jgi:tetratricopeptide (TPR) repeat protein
MKMKSNYLLFLAMVLVGCSKPTAENLYTKAIESNRAGDIRTAIKYLDEAIQLDSAEAKYFCQRGFIKQDLIVLDTLYYKEAMIDFNKAIKLKPDYAEAYFKRGVAKFNRGYKTDACEDWEMAKKLGYERSQPTIDRECFK